MSIVASSKIDDWLNTKDDWHIRENQATLTISENQFIFYGYFIH